MWFQPRRPRVAEATAIADAGSTGLWERMIAAGLVAPSAERGFVGYDDGVACEACNGTGLRILQDPTDCGACDGWGSLPRVQRRGAPLTTRDCIALAADGDALQAVEALARAVAAGVDVWHRQRAPSQRALVWVSEHWHPTKFPTRPLLEAHGDVAVLFDNNLRLRAFGPAHYPKIPEAIRVAEALFAEHVRDPRIRREKNANNGLGEAAFQVVYTAALYDLLTPSLPNVFPSLFRIFEHGYAMQGLTADRIELLVPPEPER